MTTEWLPRVSIVTVSFNTGRYIEQAIRSVKAQSYPNIEHIIIDGGSTDNTLAILEKYRGTYDLIYLSERDSGPTEALKKGFKLAKGDIQGALPADDLLVPWAVSSVVSAFRKNPDADLVHGDLLLMPADGKLAALAFNPPDNRLKRHLSFGPMNINSVFWKKRVMEELKGFDENLMVAADYDFCIRAAQRFKFHKVNEALGVFRFRGGNISTRDRGLLKQNRDIINRRHFGGRQASSIQLLLYEFGWTAYCAQKLMQILAGGDSANHDSAGWANLRRRETISRSRLLLEFLVSPLLYTNAFFGMKVRHGFIDAERLVQHAIAAQ